MGAPLWLDILAKAGIVSVLSLIEALTLGKADAVVLGVKTLMAAGSIASSTKLLSRPDGGSDKHAAIFLTASALAVGVSVATAIENSNRRKGC
ncbi:hypothetical protein CYMTET_35210 [Cymbomonas tetramitiformis]|uniref:Uncharacterized protein n=1 Tax=Cymbomonas tetramitiformis TaxID=36881 RepID=A0AAE0KP71_9CHLO|nr:hypothetical protein CYMTET_35210 [Cymbomonas tetramitiformis]